MQAHALHARRLPGCVTRRTIMPVPLEEAATEAAGPEEAGEAAEGDAQEGADAEVAEAE